MLGEDHRPLVVRKDKSSSKEEKKREAPPEKPVVDVSEPHFTVLFSRLPQGCEF